MTFYCPVCSGKEYPRLEWSGFDYCRSHGHQIQSTLQNRLTGVKWDIPKETPEEWQARLVKYLRNVTDYEHKLERLCIDLLKDGCNKKQITNALFAFNKSSRLRLSTFEIKNLVTKYVQPKKLEKITQ